MMLAIFIVLCAILGVLILMLPEEKRADIAVAVKVGLAFALLGGIIALIAFLGYIAIMKPQPVIEVIHNIPWWAYALFVAVVIIGAFWSDARENRKIRAGDPVATERKIQALMDGDGVLKYTRAQAEEAVERIRTKGGK